jgi:DNA polymerase-1
LDLARGTFRFETDEDGKVRAKGYSLFDLAVRRLGVRLDKDTWRMRYHELWDIPLEEWPQGARDYADADAVTTLRIYEAQEKLSKYLGNEAAQVRAHFALHLMSAWGFMTDADRVEELETWVAEELATIEPKLMEAGLVRSNGTRDTKRAVKRMVEAMGEESILTDAGLRAIQRMEKTRAQILVEARAGSGKFVSVSADATMMSGDTTLMDYSRFTQLRNLTTGSIKDLRRGTILPIQSRFEVLMETGRTSSSGPNIQNLRRAPGVRECFVPREGCVLVACDYSAAELHTLAQVCFDLFGKSALGDALNEGIDVHLWVGAHLMGVSYEDAESLLKAGDPNAKDARQLAKAANFGFPGGCSPKRFVGIAHAYGREIEIRSAARLKALWLSTWPEMRAYFDHVGQCTDGDGWHWVKQLRAERLRSRTTYTSACNSYFQGLAADGAKAAAYAVARAQHVETDSPLFGARSVAFIHDEIIMEVEESQAHAAALELSEVMEREFNHFVPDCPTQAEPTIMRWWSKKAVPVWTDDGRLVPWAG